MEPYFLLPLHINFGWGSSWNWSCNSRCQVVCEIALTFNITLLYLENFERPSDLYLTSKIDKFGLNIILSQGTSSCKWVWYVLHGHLSWSICRSLHGTLVGYLTFQAAANILCWCLAQLYLGHSCIGLSLVFTKFIILWLCRK